MGERPADCLAAAGVWDADGGDEEVAAVGFVAVWECEDAPVAGALRADPGAFAADGDAAYVSLVLPPAGMRPAFDDLAVQQARRALLAGPPPAAITTLLADDSHFAGSLTARRGQDAVALLRDDPFARVLPARLLRCGAGLLADRAPPPGPTIERHGSAVPWPGGRF
jgi:hypothetical protein